MAPAAGEGQATTVYDARFSFIPTTPEYQPGLFTSVSPDDGQGGRMSWIGLEDTPAGIAVDLSEASGPDGAFQDHRVAVLSREEPHTMRFWIQVNPGAADDFLRLFIDGEDVGECFTTWEEYYRNAEQREPPMINRLQFRLSVAGPDALLGAGYLFDNVTATASPATSAECAPDGDDPDDGDGQPDVVIDKTTTTRSAQPGDLITYRISVRNRGDAAARDLRACDRPPRALPVRRGHAPSAARWQRPAVFDDPAARSG